MSGLRVNHDTIISVKPTFFAAGANLSVYQLQDAQLYAVHLSGQPNGSDRGYVVLKEPTGFQTVEQFGGHVMR